MQDTDLRQSKESAVLHCKYFDYETQNFSSHDLLLVVLIQFDNSKFQSHMMTEQYFLINYLYKTLKSNNVCFFGVRRVWVQVYTVSRSSENGHHTM